MMTGLVLDYGIPTQEPEQLPSAWQHKLPEQNPMVIPSPTVVPSKQ